MSDTDNNQHLLELLELHRRRLRHLRQQAAVFDPGLVPSHVALGLAEACRDVAHLKGELRSSGTPVDDLPEDDLPGSPIDPSSGGGAGRAGRFNIQGSIQAGVVNIGGLMNVEAPVQVTFGGGSTESQDGVTTREIRGEPPGRTRISQLAAQLEAVLAGAPIERTPITKNVALRMQALVEAAVASVPDRDLIAFQAESLRRAAAPLGSVLPDIDALIEALISACSETQHT
jgi:hypothetical protein